MESQKYSVYNKTRGTYLSPGVLVIDTTLESFNLLLDKLADKSGFGLWLTPFRGIPAGHALHPIDLIYLDQQHRVAQAAESFPTAAFEALKVPAASALALPVHAISSSQTQSGDELIICAPEEMEQQIALTADVPAPIHATQSNESAEVESENIAANNSASQDSASRKLRSAIRQLEEKEKAAEAEAEEKPSLITRFLRWLYPEVDRRRALRSPLQGLVAYYWTGGVPQAYSIGDISTKGVYLLTDDRWAPETVILITLQKTGKDEDDPEGSISVQSRVARWGLDGLGLEFVLSEFIDQNSGEVLPGRAEDKKALEHFLQGLSLPHGAEPVMDSH